MPRWLGLQTNDDDKADDHVILLQLVVQEKYVSHDLILLTKMDITIPIKTSDLKHHMKHCAGCGGTFCVQDLMIYM